MVALVMSQIGDGNLVLSGNAAVAVLEGYGMVRRPRRIDHHHHHCPKEVKRRAIVLNGFDVGLKLTSHTCCVTNVTTYACIITQNCTVL